MAVPPIAIADFALCTALGCGAPAHAAALLAGRSGLRPAELGLPFATHVGALPFALPALPARLAAYDTAVARVVALLAGELSTSLSRARRQFGAARIGLAIGTARGGLAATEAFDSARRTQAVPSAAYDFTKMHALDGVLQVARAVTGAAGPGVVVATGGSSGAKSFAVAQRWLHAGIADAVVCGGADVLSQTELRGRRALGALAEGPCRPFGAGRCGASLGEGGALFVLCKDGPARGRLLGAGESSDGGAAGEAGSAWASAAQSIQRALQQAGAAAELVSHVNANAAGSPTEDYWQAEAIGAALGPRVPVVSTQGYTGDLQGAAGAVGAALALICLRDGILPASLGAEPADALIALPVPVRPDRRAQHAVAVHSAVFGGAHVCLLLGGA